MPASLASALLVSLLATWLPGVQPATLARPSATVGFEGLGPDAFRVHAGLADHQRHSAVARNAAGLTAVAWEGPDGSDSGVYVQRYTAAGEPIGGEMRVNQTTLGLQGFPALAMGSDGDFVVTWTSSGHAGGIGLDILARRFDAGTGRLTPESIVSPVTGNQHASAVAIDSDGDFIVAWQSSGHAGGDSYDVIARRYDAGTGSYAEPFIVNATRGIQQAPALAMNDAGDFVIAWQSAEHAGGEGPDILLRRYAAGSDRLAPDIIVNAITGSQTLPAVAMAADGDFVVAWQSEGHAGAEREDILIRRFEAGHGSPETLVNTLTGIQRCPAVAMDADGDFVVAWQSSEPDTRQGFDVLARRFGAGSFAPEAVLTALPGFQGVPEVAMDADGDFVSSWASVGHPEGEGYDVFARFYAARPTPP